MVRPRWQVLKQSPERICWHRWNQVLALCATANLIWIIFDVTYIPLRNFWINRTIDIVLLNKANISLKIIPNITPFYDPIKGIQDHSETKSTLENFTKLDQVLLSKNRNPYELNKLIKKQRELTRELFESYYYIGLRNVNALDKLQSKFKSKTTISSYKEAASYILSKEYLDTVVWNEERKFWNEEIIPLIKTNYSRTTDRHGNPINQAWRIDIPFQILFILDILIKTVRFKRRFPAISWRDALLRRWIDLPLILPFWRLTRIMPITERLYNSNLIQIEPIRAVISQGIVALLAIEIFEVFTLRIVDSLQNLIRSSHIPQRIRSLCSHQRVNKNNKNEINKFIGLWLPLLLNKIGPNMRPQLIALFDHALQRSLERSTMPNPIRNLAIFEKAESVISYQLASGMVDALLDLSKSAGDQLGQKDLLLEQLSLNAIDRFWEELACTLDKDDVLKESQQLLLTFLEELKRLSFNQLKNQGTLDDLITELDGLNFSSTKPQPNKQV